MISEPFTTYQQQYLGKRQFSEEQRWGGSFCRGDLNTDAHAWYPSDPTRRAWEIVEVLLWLANSGTDTISRRYDMGCVLKILELLWKGEPYSVIAKAPGDWAISQWNCAAAT